MSDFMRMGALSEPKNVNTSTLNYLMQLKDDINKSVGNLQNADNFKLENTTPLAEQTQIVSGIKYVVKLQQPDKKILQITFWKKPDGSLSLLETRTI